jgi:hypothetical protein
MALKDNIPLNFELLSNPVNWVIILLMVAIAGMAVNLIFAQPSSGDN